MPPIKPVEVFISFHEEDEERCKKLEQHLAAFSRRSEDLKEKVIIWHKHKMLAGQATKDEIDKYLNRSGLILLLLSADFFDSDSQWEVEVTKALARHHEGKACVIPVLLRAVDWEISKLKDLPPLPTNRRPIDSWSNRDEAFRNVSQEIRKKVQQLFIKSNPLLRNQEVTSLINKADHLYKQKKFEEAVLKYAEALDFDRDNVNAHNNLGNALKAQNRLDEAIASYGKALELNPKDAKTYNNLGNALKAQNRLDEAIASYGKALKLNPKDAKTYNNLGNALKAQGKLKDAIECYGKALELNRNYALAHNNLGLALYKQGNLEKAIQELEQAVCLDPSSDLFRNHLQTIRNKRNQYRDGCRG